MKLVGYFAITFLLVGLCVAEEQESQEDTDTISHAFDEVFGNSDACFNACERTFPLHTYDKPGSLEACNRGCRLFSICEWADDDGSFNKTIIECSSACEEAYNSTDGVDATSCKVGCKSAVSPAKERKTELYNEEPHIQVYVSQSSSDDDPMNGLFSQVFGGYSMPSPDSMFLDMFNYMSQMMQFDNEMMKSSSVMSTIDDSDDTGIIIIQFNSPEINTQHPIDEKLKQNTDGNKIHSKTTLVDRIFETNLQTNLYEGHRPFTGDYWIDSYDVDFEQNVNFRDQFEDWWNSFVKNAGLPELALMLFWICTMVLLVMCCAMQFPSEKRTKLSVYGDLAYIKETKGRIPEFLKVYGHSDVVQFSEVKKYKPDEKIPFSSSF